MQPDLLERLLNISQQMAETRALTPLLNYVIDEAIDLVGAERGYIVLLQPDETLDIRVKRGRGGQDLVDTEEQISRSVFGKVVETGQPLILRDAINDPHFSIATSVLSLQLRSIMCAPLISRSQVLGAIYVENRSISNRFKENDLSPLILFANHAAVMIENAALNDELEARVAARTRELEQRNQELREFVYVASHDLQEPLRKVQAFSDRLGARYADALDERGRDYLERMQNAVGRMQTLINDLLTYSRVASKSEPFSLVDLTQVAREVVQDLEVRIEQLHGQVEIAELPSIAAEPTQMRQLLQNLIGNALKFHRPDTPPLVQVQARLTAGRGNDPVEGEAKLPWCHLIVSDNGIGFEEKYADRIFQIFQRLNGRETYPGTGVGLAICRKIVERHHGDITVHSWPGHGTTFTISLPVRHPE
ncbi:MAG TPA: ATP-binding protein [Anaerolineae bacterium]|nr:ATP-binding protein [Anaerolineae bacterium]